MFAYKREHPDFLRDLFIWGDVHYTSAGNDILAYDLIALYGEDQYSEVRTKTRALRGIPPLPEVRSLLRRFYNRRVDTRQSASSDPANLAIRG